MPAFLGMRGTGDWVTNQRPEAWNPRLLLYYPNGAAQLTAIMSMIGKTKYTDPHFHWFSKTLPDQRGAVTGVYTDSGLSSAYASGGVAGDTLYVKMAEADADKFNAAHVIMLTDADDKSMRARARVSAVTKAGASSYLTVKLLEADDNGSTKDLSDTDTALIIGSAHPEGATSPDAIMYDVVEEDNYMQIFRTSIEHTGTALATELRTGDAKKEARRENLLIHGIEREKALLFGVPSQTTGSNGKPLRTSGGLDYFIQTNRFNFLTDGGGTWLSKGEDWINAKVEQAFRYGSEDKLMLCGSGLIAALNRLALANGHFALAAETKSYGIKVMSWVTAHGEIPLKPHPLFTTNPLLRNSGFLVEPKELQRVSLKGRDTILRTNIQANDADSEKDEWLTEEGYEIHFELAHSVFHNVGVDPA